MKRLTPYLAALAFMIGMGIQSCREHNPPTPTPICSESNGLKYCHQPAPTAPPTELSR